MEDSGAMSTFLPDGEHASDVYCEECQCFVKELCWQHATTVHDAPTVPLAVASLPDFLYFERGHSVFAKRALRPHTIFGPLIAHGHTSTLTLKMDNDNCSNWMKFVSVVGQWEEPNLRLLLRDEQVVFVSVKVVLPGEELKLAIEPRYMPMMDPHLAKPTRFADVRLQLSEDSLSLAEGDSEVRDSSACDVKDIVIDACTVGTCASDKVASDLTMKTDPIPQLPLQTTVKDEQQLDRDASLGYSFPPLFVPPMVTEEENETDSERHDDAACAVTQIMVDDVVSNSASDKVPTGLTKERDPIKRMSLVMTAKSGLPSDRESSPEYPFPPVSAVSKIAKQKDNHDAPIGRYPFRSRRALDVATSGNNQREPEALPIDPAEEEFGGMTDDDFDRDYRLSASDEEASTDSESYAPADSLPPAKRLKPSTISSAKGVTCQVPSISAAITNAATFDRLFTVGSETAPALTKVPTVRYSGNEQQRRRGHAHPSDIYRFVCPVCALHFFSDQVLQWHRQFQHGAIVNAPWTPGTRCGSCKTSRFKRHTMAAHVEEHGIKPERVQHFRPTNDPRIMRHVASSSDSVPAGSMMDHEPHKLCFMYSSSVCKGNACSLRFCSDELVAVHEMQHSSWQTYQGALQCPGCSFIAQNGVQLVEHVTQHGAKSEDRKMCRVCGEFKMRLQEHMALRHKTEYDRFMEGSPPETCSECGKSFRNLKGHIALAHTARRLRCFICAKQFPTTDALKKHCNEHKTPNGFTCPTCQEVIPTYLTFSAHVKKHDVMRMRVCEVCQAVVPNAVMLRQHMVQHGSDYKYRCEPCGKSFKRKGNLAQHNQCVHGERFKQKRKERKEEMAKQGYVCPRLRMDYEDFPHKCEECRLGWLRLGGLEQHRMRKHGDVDRTET